MPGVRACRVGDIPALVQLRRKSFRTTEHADDSELGAYYQRVFFENPWYDGRLVSLVYESPDGRPQGFLGVISRPMRLGSESIRAAVSTEFMVDPAHRGVAGVLLLRALLDGPQDLTVSDRANEPSRQLFQSLGGEAAMWHSLHWECPLRPLRYAASRLEWPGFSGLVRPVANLFDAAAVRAPGHFRRRRPATLEAPLNVTTIVSQLPHATQKYCLAPVYDIASLRWLLQCLADRCTLGELHQVELRDHFGATVGWFIYALQPNGRADVVQFAALNGRYREALTHLFYHAWQRGAVAVAGRLDGAMRESLLEDRPFLSLAEPWTIIHSRRPDVLAAFQRGTAFLSRLDSEWWLGC